MNAYLSLSIFTPPFFYLYLSFYLKDTILTYSWSHEALHTGLKAIMMTEPTPIFLKVLLLISLKRNINIKIIKKNKVKKIHCGQKIHKHKIRKISPLLCQLLLLHTQTIQHPFPKLTPSKYDPSLHRSPSPFFPQHPNCPPRPFTLQLALSLDSFPFKTNGIWPIYLTMVC
jgi:hypothetical protein